MLVLNFRTSLHLQWGPMSREAFSDYVRRVMKQKGLKAADVERNSGDKIDRSHVSKFISGTETNPSAKAMMALAKGLVHRNQNSLRNGLSCFSVLVWQEKHNLSSSQMTNSVL
jgi:transcriptional regulator with XRE-family HTH domain